jgi:hypothetical protein
MWASLTDQKEFIFDPKDKYRVMPEALMPVARLGGLT